MGRNWLDYCSLTALIEISANPADIRQGEAAKELGHRFADIFTDTLMSNRQLGYSSQNPINFINEERSTRTRATIVETQAAKVRKQSQLVGYVINLFRQLEPRLAISLAVDVLRRRKRYTRDKALDEWQQLANTLELFNWYQSELLKSPENSRVMKYRTDKASETLAELLKA